MFFDKIFTSRCMVVVNTQTITILVYSLYMGVRIFPLVPAPRGMYNSLTRIQTGEAYR
jgi:hypothetical protein